MGVDDWRINRAAALYELGRHLACLDKGSVNAVGMLSVNCRQITEPVFFHGLERLGVESVNVAHHLGKMSKRNSVGAALSSYALINMHHFVRHCGH